VDHGNGLKQITFLTSGTPADVIRFYRDTLVKDGWVNPLVGNSYPANIFEWHQGGPDGPTDLAYRLTIHATSRGTGETSVEIELLKYDPIRENPTYDKPH
jgi:hypothetical protein